MRTSSFPPIYVSTKEESFFLNFFVLRGAKNTSKTCGLTRVRTRDSDLEVIRGHFCREQFYEWFGGKRQFLENTDEREFCDHSCVRAYIFSASLKMLLKIRTRVRVYISILRVNFKL